MTVSKGSRWIATAFLLGIAGYYAAYAQTPPWADSNYRYRRPLTISNTAGAAINTGDVLAYSYIPGYGPFDGKMSTKDIKIFWQPDNDITATHTDVKQAMVDLGATSAKILFSAKAPIAAGTPRPFAKGTDSSTFQETGTPQGLNADEEVRVLTIPFSFPFLGANYTKLTVSTNGWIAFESGLTDTHYGDLSLKNVLETRKFITPLGYDLDTSSYVTGADVFYDTSVAGQVTVRWKADTFTDTTVRAPRINTSVTLFSDGRVRLNYGSVVTPIANQEPPFGCDLGIATGNVKDDLLIHLPVPYDLSNHAPILFTPNPRNVVTDSTYYVYYGNSTDTGIRTPPDAANLTYYSFKTLPSSSAQGGWVAASGNPDTGTISRATITGGGSVMKVAPLTSTGMPLAIAAAGPDFTDQTIYTRLEPTGSGGVGIMARANANNQGYGFVLNDFANLDGVGTTTLEQGIIVRSSPANTPPDYTVISAHADGAVPTTNFANVILRVVGSAATSNIDVQAKSYLSGGIEPAGFQYETIPAAALPQLSSGKVGVTGSGGGGTVISVPQVNYVYVVPNGFAEYISVATGADNTEIQQPPPPGKGTLAGTVTDAATTAPIPGITVTITPSGGGTAITPAPTNNAGFYTLYLDPGTYNVSFASPGYTELIQTVSVVAAQTATLNGALVAPELVTNGGFETPDPAAPAYKPLGWYRRDYVTPVPAGETIPEPNPAGEVYNPGWRYVTNQGHTGTHCVELRGPFYISYPQTNGTPIISWEPEGTVLSINADPTSFGDCRSKGPMIPEASGATFHVTAWVKKVVDSGATAGGQAILRLRPDIGGDDPSVLLGGNSGVQISKDGSFDWTQLSYNFTVPSSVNGNFLQTRLYGSSLLDGNSVFWDDVSVHRIQLPVFRGSLHSSPAPDGTVTLLSGVTVGVREAGANGMSSPLASVDTDALGRWSLSFLPDPGVSYVVQAYPDVAYVNQHVSASANFPLQPATSVTDMTYDPAPTTDIALFRPVLAYSSRANTSSLPGNAFDDGNTRWTTDSTTPAGTNPRGYNFPQFLVVDLGQTYDFSKISQIALQSYNNGPDHYQWRVSNTPPPANPDLFTYVEAATYGTLLYDSPQSIGARWAQTPGYQAYMDLVTAPQLKPVFGRYLELYIDKYYGFNTNFDFYEIKVESLPVTITGKVVDSAGNPVAGAKVGQFPDPPGVWTTNALGNFTATLPGTGTYTLTAHIPSSTAATVQPLSTPGTLTPYPGMAGPVLMLPAEVPNLVVSVLADPARTDLQTAGTNLPAAAGDKDFTTKWETDIIAEAPPAPTVSLDNPVHITADLGSAQPFNQVILNWEYDTTAFHVVNATQDYSIDVSNDNTTFTPVYTTFGGNGGYRADLTTTNWRLVAPIKFPTQTARYVRLTMSGHIGDILGMWEMQVGNAPATVAPFTVADVQRALQIASGFIVATPADISRLSKDGVKITIPDAVRIDKTANGH
ncbi:MAG TPA: carboxypeptidase regulatory-like domain-containing protein [Armatimonadota bacterium]|jgi:hypothetical protein